MSRNAFDDYFGDDLRTKAGREQYARARAAIAAEQEPPAICTNCGEGSGIFGHWSFQRGAFDCEPRNFRWGAIDDGE